MIDVLPQLRNLGLDDNECVIVVREAFPGSGLQHAPDGVVHITAGATTVARAIPTTSRSISLAKLEVSESEEAKVIEAMRTAAVTHAPKVTGTTLFTDRPMTGFAKVDGWVQIRPIETKQIPDLTGEQQLPGAFIMRRIPRPISLEVYHPSSSLPFLEAYRAHRALHEAICLMMAFLEIPVYQVVQAYSYAMVDWKVAIVRGAAPDLPERPNDKFSDVSGLHALNPIELNIFLDQLGLGHVEFRVPDLNLLWTAYKKLTSDNKLRFLRAGANLRDAANPAASNGSRIVASVFAIEALIARRNQGSVTRRFKKFVDEYVRPDARVRSMYRSVYDSRSDLAHGRWHIGVDEPFLGFLNASEWTPMIAWSAAKRGVINWLLAQ